MGTDTHVLVAYDGSRGAKRALAQAADLATRTHHSLRIFFAEGPIPGEADATPALREAVDALVGEAVKSVAATHPDLPVDSAVVWTAPRKAIIEASADAAVTVVGRRGHGPLKSLLLGSVSGSVAAHAASPVLVVPDTKSSGTASSGTASSGTASSASGAVVVGIDGSAASLEAADTAVALAGGRPVVLVLAWQPMQTAHAALGPYGGMIVTDPEAEEADHQRLLDHAVAQVSAAHPDIEVEGRLVGDDPTMALRDASESASLVVVSTRGHGGFTGLLLGSVAQSLIQTSECPVLVTRPRDH